MPATKTLAMVLTDRELATVAAQCGANISALATGATPSYYVPGVSDGFGILALASMAFRIKMVS